MKSVTFFFHVLATALIFALTVPNSVQAQSSNRQKNATRISGEAAGDLILGGPGVGLNYKRIYEVPFAHQVGIGRYFRFKLTGIEAQADADGVAGAYAYDGYMWNKAKKNNNGHGNNIDGVDSSNQGSSKEGEDSDPTIDDEIKFTDGETSGETTGGSGATHVPGWWEFWAQVNNVQIRGLSFETAELHQLSNLMRLYLSTPVVFKEQEINLSWSGDGNSSDPDGHFYILGSAIKEPPVPIGELAINQTTYLEGEKPPFKWEVHRD